MASDSPRKMSRNLKHRSEHKTRPPTFANGPALRESCAEDATGKPRPQPILAPMKIKTICPVLLRRRQINRRAARKWARKHPMAARAHGIARRALRDGILIKGPCEVCGASKVHAHHDDYGEPLNVRWLCVTHHWEHHKKIRLVQAELNFGKRKESAQ